MIHTLESKHLSSSSYSLSVIDLSNDSLVYSADPKRSLTPASINKLFTTKLALDILGEDFTFETKVAYNGTISNDTLQGNIYIIGSGDPTLESKRHDQSQHFFSNVTQSIKNKGIKHIKGNIISLSAEHQNNANPTWTWQDIGNYYGAASYDLNIYENTLNVFYKTPKTIGQTATITHISPQIPVETISTVQSSKLSYDSSYFYGGPDELLRTGKGKLPANRKNFKVKASMPNPPLMASYLLKEELKKSNIQANSHSTSPTRPDSLTIIHRHTSPRLTEIINTINKKSHNLYAEAIFKATAAKSRKSWPSSYIIASNELEAKLKKKISDTLSFNYSDGSGLSRFNSCTSLQIAELLTIAHKAPYSETFKKSLAISGEDGTLKSFGTKSAIKGKVIAKTGSMTGVRSLAGYLTSKSGKTYAFCFIINNFEGKQKVIKKDFLNILEELHNTL